MRNAAIALVVAGAALAFFIVRTQTDTPVASPQAGSNGAAIVDIAVPEDLSEKAKIGKVAFDAKCASCHGANAVGQEGVAPPLVHIIYEPSHHADEAFQRAVAGGVRSHHWRFGDMPPVDGLTRGDVGMIVAYIRELQRANGIN